MKKRFLTTLLLALVLAISAALPAWAEQTGTSDNITWRYDETTKTLNFEGTGILPQIDLPDEIAKNTTNVNIGNGITEMTNLALICFSNLQNVRLPDTLIIINDGAFCGCRLTKVTIPEGVTTIGACAFEGCTNLTEITLPNSLTTIGENAFICCTGLTEITIPKGVTDIGMLAFHDCDKLTAINVAADNPNYSSLDGVLFNKNKTTLVKYPAGKVATSYTIPAGVTSIYDCAFADCESLTEITIPKGVTSIGVSAFARDNWPSDYDKQKLSLPDTLTSIGDDAFNNWYLENIVILPDMSTYDIQKFFERKLNESYFDYYGGIIDENTTFCISDDNPTYSVHDGVFFNKDKTTLLVYPKGRTDTSYTVPNGVTDIGKSSFLGCKVLMTINIPASVTAINQEAFYGCSDLIDVYYAGNKSDWQAINLGEYNAPFTNATIHYNSGSTKAEQVFQRDFATAVEKKQGDAAFTKTAVLTTGNGAITYSSSNEAVATVDNTGKVTITGLGDVIITASAAATDDYNEATISYALYIAKNNTGSTKAEQAFKQDFATAVIKTQGDAAFTKTAVLTTGNGAITYSSSDETVATVDNTGKVTIAGVGTATITAAAAATDDYNKATISYTLTVNKKNSGGSSSGGGSNSNSSSSTTKPAAQNIVTATKPDNKTTVSVASFTDTKDHWASTAINWAVKNGLMNGTPGNRFAPNEKTSRGQLVTMLYRLEKEPTVGTAAFRDVNSNAYYGAAVAWAASNNVVTGYANGTFGANDSLTREQIALILFRYAGLKSADVTAKSDLSSFTDSAKVSGWAAPAMQWAVASGLIEGNNGALNPQGKATRAEIATILMRYCESIAK